MADWKEIRKRKHNVIECEKSPVKKQPKIDPEIVEIISDDEDENAKEILLSDDQSDLVTNDEETSEAELTDEETNVKIKPSCVYGSECYRKNAQHLAEFYHPPQDENAVEISENSSTKQKTKSSNINSKEATTSKNKTKDFSVMQQPIEENFIKYTKVNRLKNSVNSLSLNDILSIDKDSFLESAQFNYCHDIDWTLEQYPSEHRNKPMLVVHGPSQEHDLKQMSRKYRNVTLCKAKLDIAYGTHHTKMMCLRYKHGMRVVVHTISSNKTSTQNTDSKTFFKGYLKMYLEHYCNPILNDWIQQIEAHDMSSANVFLIGSIPGRYPANKKLFGHSRLRKVFSSHLMFCGLFIKKFFKLLSDHFSINESSTSQNETGSNIISQFSSIGSLGVNENSWLIDELYSSFSCQKDAKLEKKLKPICIFPSVSDVRNSFEGYSAGTSIPYSIKTAQKQNYLNKYLYKWKADSNNRTRASPHIKSYARFSDDYSKMYWFLLTSSNLSKAAWGCYEKNMSQLFIRSYELGVLFLPKFISQGCSYFDLKSQDFILPYDLPPVKYNEKDKSWCYDVSYQEKDSHGRVWNVDYKI